MLEFENQITATARRARSPVRSASLEILNKQSETHTFKVSDADWSRSIDRDLPWMPEGLVNIRFLPAYKELGYMHRLRYNQIYALAICEQFTWFERGIVIPVMKRILARKSVTGELEKCLAHFIEEEEKHAEMFDLLQKKAGSAASPASGYRFYNLSALQKSFYGVITKYPDFFIAWIWMTIYFEERTMHISRLYRESEADPLFKECHFLHMIDESRHLQIDQYLLSELYDSEPKWKRQIAAWMYEKVIAAYAAPKRISGRVLSILGEEFPQDRALFDKLRGQFHLLPKNREFIEKMFGDQAIGRTRRLLASYPEMARALRIIS